MYALHAQYNEYDFQLFIITTAISGHTTQNIILDEQIIIPKGAPYKQ